MVVVLFLLGASDGDDGLALVAPEGELEAADDLGAAASARSSWAAPDTRRDHQRGGSKATRRGAYRPRCGDLCGSR